MELEFDKEIDAILRKARDSGLAAKTTAASPHLDADTIAAFAENALPDKAKLLYMEHFADCGRCRRILSQSILFNSEADLASAHSAVAASVVAAAVPWYVKLFKTPNLALAMGGLVLVFGGVLGFVVLQNLNQSRAVDVSQMNEPQPGGPSFNNELPIENSNALPASPSANKSAAAANVPSNAASALSTPLGNVATGTLGSSDSVVSKEKTPGLDKTASSDDYGVMPAKPIAGLPPPQPATKPGENHPEAALADRKQDREKTKDEDVTRADGGKAAEERNTRDLPAAAKKAGPSRSGPVPNQMQTQTMNNMGEMPVTRLVGGKSFQNRDGAWYDSAYHGQATNNFRRGTDEYKRLDSGLRKIADNLGGTVVLVWQGKAYRIN